MPGDLYDDLAPVPHDPLDVPARAMAIGAHPDDIEFGCGGTLARWVGAGTEVTMVVVTDGSKGTWRREADPAALVVTRKQEQQRAATVLGVARVVHLEETDGELEYSLGGRSRFAELIRVHRPDVLLSHDPWQRYQLHPDHRATGLLAVDGMVAARDHLFFPEHGLEPHRPGAMLLWSADRPDHLEDISGTIDVKIAALLEHASQAESTMGGADGTETARAAFVTRIRDWAAETAAGTPLDYAEAFKRLRP